jgi:hypothetical protein
MSPTRTTRRTDFGRRLELGRVYYDAKTGKVMYELPPRRAEFWGLGLADMLKPPAAPRR